MKKILSLLLALCLTFSALPALAAENTQIIVSENFENYAENATAFENGIKVQTGIDKRIIKSEGNKSIYSKAWGEGARAAVAFTSPSDEKEMVYSVKLKLSGSKTTGKFFTLTDGTTSISFLTLSEDGSLKILGNKTIGGILYDKWNTITLIVNWNTQMFDVYINGKCKLSDWYFQKGTYLPMKEVTWSVNEPEEGFTEMYVDDIRIYTGKTLPEKMSFPDGGHSSEVLPFEEAKSLEIETVVYKNYDITDSLPSSWVNLGGTISHKKLEDGNGVMHCVADGTAQSKTYLDVVCAELANESKYVISADIFINEISGSTSRLGIFDGKDANATGWRMGASVKSNKIESNDGYGAFADCEAGKWFEIAFAYNVGAGNMNVYLDGKLVREEVPISDTFYPTIFRFDVIAPVGGIIDVYVDNIKMYKAREPMPKSFFEGEEKEEVQVAGYSILDKSEDAKKYIGKSSVFMLTNNYMFTNGAKSEYPQNAPYTENGVFMIPVSLLGKCTGEETAENAASGEIKIGALTFTAGKNTFQKDGREVLMPAAPIFKNGEGYLPLRSASVDGMGKHIHYDDRGFIVLSNEAFPYKNSNHLLEDTEPIDDIFRFMQFENPSGKRMLSDFDAKMKNVHPRIFLTNDEINYILDKVEDGDKTWKGAYDTVLYNAEKALGKVISSSTANADKQGTAEAFKGRMYTLSLAYLLTGDDKYAEDAVKNFKAASAWDTLGESYSQLTSGDWMMGMAYGFDVFYEYMHRTPEGREIFEQGKEAVKNTAFKNMKSNYGGQSSPYYWVKMRDNFPGVIAGGAIALVLSLCDEADMREDCEYLLENIYKTMQIYISLWGPDGAWYEGVSYGDYGMQNFSKGLVALQNTCGTTYGLLSAKGIDKAADWFIYMSTATASFNFHDMDRKYQNSLCGFTIAYLCGDVERMEATRRQRALANLGFDILSLMRYEKSITDKGINVGLDHLPLDHYFKVTEAGSFYSSLSSATPTFAAFHGGWTGIYHDMLDLGQFFFESDKVVWATDTGRDSYSLKSYFGIPDGYKIYRKNVQGENCLLVNPLKDPEYYGQKIDAYAPLTDFASAPRAAKAAYDLSDAYERDVYKYVRGYYFGDNRNTLTVRDEFTLKEESEFYWQMHTTGSIEIVDNNTVILSKNGERCMVDISCSAPEYKVLDMEPVLLDGSPGQKIEGQGVNSGIRKLAIYAKDVSGDVTITVKLNPENDNYIRTPIDDKTNIKDWTLPSGELPKKITLSSISVDGAVLESFYPELQEYEVTLPFGQETTPIVTAASSDGEVRVINTGKVADPVKIILSKEGYKDVTYEIRFIISSEREVFVTDALMDVKPIVGGGRELIKSTVVSTTEVDDATHGPTNLFDDNFDTRCAISGECWFEIDLGAVKDISGVALSFMDGDKRYQYLDIAYSEDGVNYKKVFSGQSTGVTSEYEYYLMPGKARYIRVYGHGNSTSTWNSITEFRAIK